MLHDEQFKAGHV